jgi:hypothetical protein
MSRLRLGILSYHVRAETIGVPSAKASLSATLTKRKLFLRFPSTLFLHLHESRSDFYGNPNHRTTSAQSFIPPLQLSTIVTTTSTDAINM